jgi:pyridoxine 4-dehydrogenase
VQAKQAGLGVIYLLSVHMQLATGQCSCAAGAIPIPGARNAEQAKELVGALGWSLDDNEVAMVEEKLAALKL